MAEDTTTVAATPQAGELATATPLAGTTAPSPDPQAGDGQSTYTLEEAKKLRSEAANLRKRLKSYEEAEEAAKLATLSETEAAKATAEKTAKQYQQYQQETEARIKAYQQQLIAARVEAVAHSLNIVDPEIAAMAIQGSLEYDDEGMPTNIKKALETLVKNKPYFVLPPAAPPESSPAQTAPPPQVQTPTLPAMNQPGRRTIAEPDVPPGPGSIQSWGALYGKTRQ